MLPVKIAARCTVFAESDLVHKAQVGYSKEDIIAGLCKSVVLNYLNNVGKGKKIESPIVFQGGVSKNEGVVKYFKEILKEDIIVDKNGHLMGALGIAILAKKTKTEIYLTIYYKEELHQELYKYLKQLEEAIKKDENDDNQKDILEEWRSQKEIADRKIDALDKITK